MGKYPLHPNLMLQFSVSCPSSSDKDKNTAVPSLRFSVFPRKRCEGRSTSMFTPAAIHREPVVIGREAVQPSKDIISYECIEPCDASE
eukprot:327997-Amorphochlora_amoeboformis.AAC.2